MSIPVLPFFPGAAEPVLPGTAAAATSMDAGSLFAALVSEAVAESAASAPAATGMLTADETATDAQSPAEDLATNTVDPPLASLTAANPQVPLTPSAMTPSAVTPSAAESDVTVAPDAPLSQPAPALDAMPKEATAPSPQPIAAAAPTPPAHSAAPTPPAHSAAPTPEAVSVPAKQLEQVAHPAALQPASGSEAGTQTAAAVEQTRPDLAAQSASADAPRSPVAVAQMMAATPQPAAVAIEVAKGAPLAAQVTEPLTQEEKPATPVSTANDKPAGKAQDQVAATAQNTPSRNGESQLPPAPQAQTQPAPQAQAPAARVDANANPSPTPATPSTALPTLTLVQEIGFANAAPLQSTLTNAAPVRLMALGTGMTEFDNLAVRIAQHAIAGDSHFDIRLDPPELGRIEVRLDMDRAGQVQAQLTAERPQTLELLQRDAAALERALKDAGLDLGNELSFSLKGEGRHALERDANARRAPMTQTDDRNAATPVAAAALAQRYYGADTRLDITV